MLVNKNILVVFNPDKDEQVALDKAMLMSARLDISITILLRRKHATAERLLAIDGKIKQTKVLGVNVVVEISEETNLLRAILLIEHRLKFDLLVKEPHKESLVDHVFLSRDWKLLRSSRCPVLFVRAGNSWDDSPVLLCVNGSAVDSSHKSLNKQIVAAGSIIAKAGDTELNVASAYPSAMQGASKQYQSPELLRGLYQRNCQDLFDAEGITDAKIHIEEGPAELMIPELADKLNAKVVVLGTVSRSGLSGILLGNTAEQILSRLTTDVLVIPPKV